MIIRKKILFLIVIVANCLPRVVIATERVYPTSDLTYLGAFRLPSNLRSSISHYGAGRGMTFFPDGNGGNGSLIMSNGVESTSDHLASEFTIPASFGTGSIASLPSAAQIRGWTSIDGGKINSQVNLDGNGADIGDVCFMRKQGSQTTDKIYWSGNCYYNTAPNEYPAIGFSETNMSSPQGLFFIGSSPMYNRVGGYLFEANHTWADAHANSRYLLNGRYRENGSYGSGGPSLFAVAPWQYGNPPSQGARLGYTTLIDYCGKISECPSDQILSIPGGAASKDRWRSGVWITAGPKQAVLFVGVHGTASNECYGGNCNDECFPEDKGYHAYPYQSYMLWYDVDHIAAYSGYGSVQPFSYALPVPTYDTSGCQFGFGGAAYQENYSGNDGRLFVAELGADSGSPVIHVFRINAGTSGDTTAPSSPSGLSVR